MTTPVAARAARFLFTVMAILGLTTAAHAASTQDAIPNGIPRALAQDRAARVSDLHYLLSYTLIAHAPTTSATETIHFNLTEVSAPLLLDFRDGQVSSLTLNGDSMPADIDHGHIVLPASLLRTGRNVVEAEFTANIGAAGKAITRFEDKDDGSEYLYSLFVPMDASQAFPCFDQPDLKARFDLDMTAPENWAVVSNTRIEAAKPAKPGYRNTDFAETQPLPTYLFAFAAGPFRMIPGDRLPQLCVRQSKARPRK